VSEQRAMTTTDTAALVEQVVVQGDLARLDAGQRVTYYRQVCESLGLNPYTRPFDYITLNGKLTLYAKRDATDQLRKLHGVRVAIIARERVDDIYVVTARATLADGRTDESIGAVAIGSLKGDALANALMKAETKAKRRVTLSIVGLGWLDETETDSIPAARPVTVNTETGEIVNGDETAQPLIPSTTEPDAERRRDPALSAPNTTMPKWAQLETHLAVKRLWPANYIAAAVALLKLRGADREQAAAQIERWHAKYATEPNALLADLQSELAELQQPALVL
jgi:hypothetical protein